MKIASFNVGDLDRNIGFSELHDRIKLLRPQLTRLSADILCLQDVHGWEREGGSRDILGVKELIATTQYETYDIAVTTNNGGEVYDEGNLVVLSRYPIIKQKQYRNAFMDKILSRTMDANKENNVSVDENEFRRRSWESPILHVTVESDSGFLHVVNVQMKSSGFANSARSKNSFEYKTVNRWAEGYFLSSMKRVGLALEVRCLVDALLEKDPEAFVMVSGDINGEQRCIDAESLTGAVKNQLNDVTRWRQLIPYSESIPLQVKCSHFTKNKVGSLGHLVSLNPLLSYYHSSEIQNILLRDESIAFGTGQKGPEADHTPNVVGFSN
ncbi:MAG: hypothetical protein OEM02_14055 [Desulfobulbaceae bacterium]|nr:hypothetical protein [Desulfobulbaceae bacterium]